MSDGSNRHSFIIEELIRITQEMIDSVNSNNDEGLQEAVRRRGILFEELGDLSQLPVSTEQQAQWMRQLQYLKHKDEELRGLLLLQVKKVRRELLSAQEEKKELLGTFARGQTLEKRV